MVEPLAIAETKELGLSFDSAILASNSTDIDNNNSFYALVIGINDYPNLDRLSGAIADADRVVKFLSTNLQVPLDHIINLRNEEASRAAIIQGFFKLRDDPRIVKGDPIFIYYAGHGGSWREKRNSGAANEVQVIFPYDYGDQEMESDRLINCIPDQTIATLLNSLSEEKGNNITVVFDSCHSASGSRDGSGVFPSMQPRCARFYMIYHAILMTTYSGQLLLVEENRVRWNPYFALIKDLMLQLRLYARQLNAGTGNELKVWFSPQAARMLFHDSDRETSQISMPSKHEVAPESLEVAFSICDSIAQAHGVSKLEQRKPAQRRNVESVLFAAAKWNWHLRRINEQHIKEGRHSVIEMGMYKVGQSIRANRRELFQDPESVQLHTMKQLSNKRSVPLYVSMFFFDATDFSIVHLFGHSASNGQGDPELPADGELFIGDAVDGGSPLKFTIPLTKKVEVGHLKSFGPLTHSNWITFLNHRPLIPGRAGG
ncbi:ICE-like protease (caspase) p20 domain protein [Rhizoctonia solani]|uniref:ICE-like protease (Caspase) p20 domain protein n=1 Tax=Rhizoctonia solani TaxID=456999 RepID=A0A8H8T2W6_9AGAM|nr:ICE-like protease (caspase) p20 domain protein [Rhizoctonia solani]QRW26008.1 ICE-like protease (caspase) p20 domain protein [Rhizoctonia solani]